MEVKIHYDNLEELTLKGVYLIRNKDNNLLKIGYCKDFKKRFKEIISSFNFVGYIPTLKIECFIECEYYQDLEKYLHIYFENSRIQNEWFNINDISKIIEFAKLFKSKDSQKENLKSNKDLVNTKIKDGILKYYKFNYSFDFKTSYSIIFKSDKPHLDFNYLNNLCYELGYNKSNELIHSDMYLSERCIELEYQEEADIYDILNSEYIIQLKDSTWIPIIDFLKPMVIELQNKEIEYVKRVLNEAIIYMEEINLEDNNSIKDNYNKMYNLLEEELYYYDDRRYIHK